MRKLSELNIGAVGKIEAARAAGKVSTNEKMQEEFDKIAKTSKSLIKTLLGLLYCLILPIIMND